MNPVKICVVEVGAIGQAHVKVIHKNTDYKLHSIVDIAPSAQESAKRLSVPIYQCLEEMLQGEHPLRHISERKLLRKQWYKRQFINTHDENAAI